MKNAQAKSIFIMLLMLFLIGIIAYAMSITPNHPVSEWSTSSSTNFNFTVSAEVLTLSWCAVYVNETFKANYTDVANNTPFVRGIAIPESAGQTVYWNATCYNGTNQVSILDTVTDFGVDYTTPSIVLDDPVDDNYFGTNSITLHYTPTDSSNPDTCLFYTNITGWAVNQTNASYVSGTQIPVNLTYNANNTGGDVIPDGVYIWNVWCNDSVPQSAWAEDTNRTFTVDTVFPGIVEVSLPATGSTNNDTTPYVEWNQTDETNFDSYTVYVSTNYTFTDVIQTQTVSAIGTNYTNLTELPANAIYFIKVGVLDLAGNSINSSITNYTIDTNLPSLTINFPSNNSYLSDNTPDFNVTVDDNNPGSCVLYISNNSANLSTLQVNNTIHGLLNGTQYNLTGATALNDGVYLFNIGCNDTFGRSVNGSDSLLTLTIDTISPTEPNFTTSNWLGTNNTDKRPTLEWLTVTETNFDIYRVRAFNKTTNRVAYEVNVSTRTVNYTNLNLSAGYSYNFSITAFDLAGNSADNVNDSAITTYYVDSICGILNPGWNFCGATWLDLKNLSRIGAETAATFVTLWNSSNHQWASCNYAISGSGVNCHLNVGINNTFDELDTPVGGSVAPLNVSYPDTNLTNGSHYYKIVAVDTGGRETAASDELHIILNHSDGNATVLSWTAVTNADTYRIYNSSATGEQATYFIVGSANVTFNHTGQTPQGSGTPSTVNNAYFTQNSISHAVWIYVNTSTEWRNRTWTAYQADSNITLTNFSNRWNNVAGIFRNGRVFNHLGDGFDTTNVSMFTLQYNNGTSIPYINQAPFSDMAVNTTTVDFGRAMWVYYNGTASAVKQYDVGGW